MMTNTSTASPWILTDDDTNQYIRLLWECCFECCQIEETPKDGIYAVYWEEVDLNERDWNSEEFFQTYLEPYVYESLKELYETYHENRFQVIAECVFETEMPLRVPAFTGSYSACEAFLRHTILEDSTPEAFYKPVKNENKN